jgi:aldehyde:ferredoxin oxidoreductase
MWEHGMTKGYMGKILWVDLSSGAMTEDRVPEATYRDYLGGIGLSARLLYDRIPAGADALGPDNILGFAAGLLTGTGSLFTGRWMAVGKSPLTGGWGDANCGGNFSPAIKRCGYDGIFFSGVSPRPVYFVLDKEGPALRDADHLWGKDTVETQRLLGEAGGGGERKLRVACIGPAGEKRSLMAGIVNDGGRIAARSGLGAVMGAKKLKAVALGGAGRITAADAAEMKRLSRLCNAAVRDQSELIKGILSARVGTLIRILPAQVAMDGRLYMSLLDRWGTSSMNQVAVEIGDSPIRNWKGSNEDFGPERSEPLSPDAFSDPVIVKYHCYSCPLGCGGLCLTKAGAEPSHKPEYETVMALGGLLLNNDRQSIFTMNEMLNRAGMDSISAGGTVAFAVECFEKGLLTRSDTDGLELTWGNSAAIMALVVKMIRREGIGDLLADGCRKAAEKIGQNSIRYAIQAGGQELGMHDGRFDPGFALHNCVEPTPGRHTIGSQLYYEMFRLWTRVGGLPDADWLYTKNSKFAVDADKIKAAAACSRYMNVINGAGACLFGAFLGADRLPVFEWLNAATGWRRTPDDYMTVGERVQTLRQQFNVKHGIRPADFKMSDRALGRPPQERGANKGRSVPIEEMMRAYWQAFGWDPDTGEPTGETLRRLRVL